MASTLPLAGLRIVVTRPHDQAEPLRQGIEKLGGVCIPFPLLAITSLLDDAPLRAVVARLHEFHLGIFISPNAVRYGMEAILKAGGLPATLKVATIGSSSAKALHHYGITEVISPPLHFNSEALLALPELQNMAHKRVLIFRGNGGREWLGDTLKLRGAMVEDITCYQRSRAAQNEAGLIAAMPDAISLHSSEAVRILWQILSTSSRQQLISIPLFVAHERIAVEAHNMGWKNINISATGTDAGLLAELLTWATHTLGRK